MRIKLSLYSLIFFASAIVMILEIIGAKFLTPVLGGSQVVWISQILVTLLSLSIGAYLSSFKFFKEKGLLRLSFLVITSSLYFLLIIVNFQSLYSIFLGSSSVLSSLNLSLFFYFIPLTTLGISFPLITLNLMNTFSIPLGKISFISTMGSVFGTLLTYFLVSYLTNDYILSSVGLLMIVFGCILMYLQSKKMEKYFTSIFILSIICLASSYFLSSNTSKQTEYKTISRINSHFGEITLLESDKYIIVANDRLVQNKVDKLSKKSATLFNYFLMDTPYLYRDKFDSALVLGLGAGIVSTELTSRGVDVDSVEINDQMIDLAKNYFGFKGKVFLEDARIIVKKSKKKYDLVVLDAFLVDSVPKHLLTIEFFNDLKNTMTDDAILVINSFGKTGPLDYVSESTYKTLKANFNTVQIYSINEWNVFYLVSNQNLVKRNKEATQPEEIKEKFTKLMSKQVLPQMTGKIITDNDSSIEVRSVNSDLYRKTNSL